LKRLANCSRILAPIESRQRERVIELQKVFGIGDSDLVPCSYVDLLGSMKQLEK
jgi:hypothetical protein